jgi:hypothetical protein
MILWGRDMLNTVQIKPTPFRATPALAGGAREALTQFMEAP